MAQQRPRSDSVQSLTLTRARQRQGCKQPSLQRSQASVFSEPHLEFDEAEEEG